jgi:hypothetical protein
MSIELGFLLVSLLVLLSFGGMIYTMLMLIIMLLHLYLRLGML